MKKVKLLTHFCALLVLSLSFSIIGFSQGIGDRNREQGRGTYRIAGRIVLPDGSPATGVKVSASGAETLGSSARADKDGNYEISGLSSGNYTVTVNEKGYRQFSDTITIGEGSGISGQAFQLPIYLQLDISAKTNPLLAGVPKNALSKFQQGVDKLSGGKAREAVALFDEAITAYPSFTAAFYEKGTAYLQLNDLDNALAAFVQAIQLKSDYVDAKYSYGYTEYLKKNYEVAAAVFDDVLKQKADMPMANLYLGISLYYLKNVNAAISPLQKAVAAKPDVTTALAHRFLGGIYMMQNKNGDAAAELQKYLDLVPKTPDADKLKAKIADLKKQG